MPNCEKHSFANWNRWLERVLRDKIAATHGAITQKFPIGNTKFDAWYTNRDCVSQSLLKKGRQIAKELREACQLQWRKDLPEELSAALRKKGTSPQEWEDSPDGALAGLAILLAGWVANQAAAKSRDNPQDCARQIFQTYIRPLIIASMDLGIEMAQEKGKS